MSLKKPLLLVLLGTVIIISACKKEGCTDENAINYSPEGSEVKVSTAVEEGKKGKRIVRISVEDQGFGLKKAQQKKVFGRYYRHVHPETRHRKGTGLGLYISKTFVEGMGGTISIDREESGGTTVAIVGRREAKGRLLLAAA